MSHSEHAYTKSTLDSHRHRRSTRPITLCAVVAGLAVASVTAMPTASALVDFQFTAPGHGVLHFGGENTDGQDVYCVFRFSEAAGRVWTHTFPNGPIDESISVSEYPLYKSFPVRVFMSWECPDSPMSKGSASVYVM